MAEACDAGDLSLICLRPRQAEKWFGRQTNALHREAIRRKAVRERSNT